jgi:hypothetical protein
MTDTEQQPSDYAQARAEAAALLDLDLERLSPADSLRLDLAVVLRRAIDTATESAFEGEPIDLTRLLGAIERLTALLPERSQANRSDPRAALLELILTMRDREENGQLAAKFDTVSNLEIDAKKGVITPTESDIVPPSEIGEFYCGPPRPRPDDHLAPPRTPPVAIEGKAVATNVAPEAKAGASNVAPEPRAPAYDYNKERGWRDYVHPDGSIHSTPMSGKYWGPV